MIPGVNPKQMQKMMKQMGMKQVDLPVVRVEMTKTDGSKLVFESPSVAAIEMMGQTQYQVTGQPREEAADTTPDISDEDVQTVCEQTSATPDEARKAIEDAGGDLADAILQLSE